MAKKSGFAAGIEAARKRRQKAKKLSGNVEAKSKAEIKPLPASKPQTYRVQDIRIADIIVGDNRRELDDATVKELVESIQLLGLKDPITVRLQTWGPKNKYFLVDGQHRLEAMKRLGKTTIPALVFAVDRRVARMWEISSTIHRPGVKELQRAEYVAEWLQHLKDAVKAGQLAPPGGVQPHDKGFGKVAKELRVSREMVRRSEKIAGISPAAKAAAKAAGLDNKQDALLKIAKEPTPNAQVAKVQELATKKPTTNGKALSDEDKKAVEALMETWNEADELKRMFIKASSNVRAQFIAKIRQDRSPDTAQGPWGK